MGQRKRLGLLAAIPFLTFSLSAQTGGSDAPPVDSQGPAQAVKVVAHWSKWEYPTEVAPAQGQQVHIVVKGDTLWDLGNKYLGNPFAWPQIWELNKWIKDPHWIYPGDPLVVEPGRGVVPQEGSMAPGEVTELQPDLRRVPKPVLEEYGFSFQDFIQMPYLVPGTAEAYFKKIGAFKLVGQEDPTRYELADGDVVYIGGGSSQGVKAGDRLVVTAVAARRFYHPEDTRHTAVLGDILEQRGVVRVTTVYPDQSVALIERSMDGITTDCWAAPYAEPAAIPNALRRDVASPIRMKPPVSKVIYIRMNKAVAAGGDMVIIDQGTSQGFKVGDVLLTARPVLLEGAKPGQTGGISPGQPTTNYYLGQLMVVHTGERTATCRILRSTEEVLVGDLLTR